MGSLFVASTRAAPWALALLWLGTVAGVRGDARARLANVAGVRAATALAFLLPFAGAVLWLLVRPAHTRLERRERRLLLAVAERELARDSDAIAREHGGDHREVDGRGADELANLVERPLAIAAARGGDRAH
jgi:hypothetical protein